MVAKRWMGALALLSAAWWLAGCEPQRAELLTEDVSTEDDVRRLFGAPRTVTVAPDGTRTLDYPRQPEGYANYVMVIAPNGKLSSLRQLLNPDNFAKVQPGMGRDDVHRMLGPHARERTFALKQETLTEWRYRDGQDAMLFEVTFDSAGRVLRTGSVADMRDVEPHR